MRAKRPKKKFQVILELCFQDQLDLMSPGVPGVEMQFGVFFVGQFSYGKGQFYGRLSQFK